MYVGYLRVPARPLWGLVCIVAAGVLFTFDCLIENVFDRWPEEDE